MEFRAPWWLRNPHLQTLAAAYWPQRLAPHRAVPRFVPLSDGDTVVVHDDCPAEWAACGRAVLMMHGLGGCHRSPLLVRLTEKLTARGVRVFRLDLRGCGAGAGLARKPYHAGCSDDLAAVVEAILEWCVATEAPRRHRRRQNANALSLALFGVSLSGNVLLKYLGEAPDRVPPQVTQAMAVNPPIDLAASVATLSRSINRWYDRYFVRALLRHLSTPGENQRATPMQPGGWTVPPRTLFEFDDLYTAPMSGFVDAADYYRRCSAAQFLPAIRVPTLVLTSRDDPMVPASMFTGPAVTWPGTVQLKVVNEGGHVGYLACRSADPDRHWLDWRIIEWLMSR